MASFAPKLKDTSSPSIFGPDPVEPGPMQDVSDHPARNMPPSQNGPSPLIKSAQDQQRKVKEFDKLYSLSPRNTGS